MDGISPIELKLKVSNFKGWASYVTSSCNAIYAWNMW